MRVDAVAARDPNLHRAPDLRVPVLQQGVHQEREAVHDPVPNDVVGHADLDGLLVRVRVGEYGLDAVDKVAGIMPANNASGAVRPVYGRALAREGVGSSAARRDLCSREIDVGHLSDEVVHVHE